MDKKTFGIHKAYGVNTKAKKVQPSCYRLEYKVGNQTLNIITVTRDNYALLVYKKNELIKYEGYLKSNFKTVSIP